MNTWDSNVAMDNLKYMCNTDLKSIRSEIGSLRDNEVARHTKQEAELNNKILKLEANFKKFKFNLIKPPVPVLAPYEEMEARLEDLNWIQNMLQTTSVSSLQSDSKERWLTECENAKNMFESNGNIKPLQSQINELNALMEKFELLTFAMALLEGQKYREAFGLFEKIYKRSRISLGVDHVNTLVAQHGAANCLTALNDHKKALELCRLVYERRCATLGSTHEGTLLAQHNIAVSLHRLGKNAEALHLFQEVYSLQVKILGLDHESSLLTKRHIEIVKNLI